jgi:hypothetical protein
MVPSFSWIAHELHRREPHWGKTYYFSVTAGDTAWTESLHSNEVGKVIQ